MAKKTTIKRTKYLLPIGPLTSDMPIHREAREAAERAVDALRDLRNEDPWACSALLLLMMSDWRGDGATDKIPRNRREVMRRLRELTTERKVTSMRQWGEAMAKKNAAASEVAS